MGLNPDVIGKIVCDRSLGLTSEADLLHLEYADIVKVARAHPSLITNLEHYASISLVCAGWCYGGPRAQGTSKLNQ